MNESQQDKSFSAEHDDFLQKYVPIELFAIVKNISEEKVIEMIREGRCVGYTKNDRWYVGRNEFEGINGNPTIEKQQAKSTYDTKKLSNNTLLRWFRGEFGLGSTFWFFGVFLGTIVLSIAFAIVAIDEDLGVFFISIATIYNLIVTVAVLRSCQYYQGSKLWAVLAIMFSLGFSTVLAFFWLIVLSVSINGYAGN